MQMVGSYQGTVLQRCCRGDMPIVRVAIELLLLSTLLAFLPLGQSAACIPRCGMQKAGQHVEL